MWSTCPWASRTLRFVGFQEHFLRLPPPQKKTINYFSKIEKRSDPLIYGLDQCKVLKYQGILCVIFINILQTVLEIQKVNRPTDGRFLAPLLNLC